MNDRKSQTNRGEGRVRCLQGSCSAVVMRMLLFPPSAKSDWLARPCLAIKWPPRDARQAQAEGSAHFLPDPLPAAAPRHPPCSPRPTHPFLHQRLCLPTGRQPPSPAVGTVPFPHHPPSSVPHSPLPSWWRLPPVPGLSGHPLHPNTPTRAPPGGAQVTNPVPKSRTVSGGSPT